MVLKLLNSSKVLEALIWICWKIIYDSIENGNINIEKFYLFILGILIWE